MIRTKLYTKLAYFFILIFVFTSCQLTTRNDSPEPIPQLSEDFLTFYDKFHTDSLFQISHIRFPLQGIPTMIDSSVHFSSFRWEKEEWVLHQPFDISNEEFERAYTLLTDDMVVEKITHINRSVGMERRFAKSDDEWFLIYYAGMNFLNND